MSTSTGPPVFAVGGDGYARYYGSVDANDSETMLMVFSASNTGTYAGAYQLGIPAPSSCTNCVDSYGLLVKAGASTYSQVFSNRNRWGDYFAVSRDTDGTGIWGEAEYVSGTNKWGNIMGFFYENSFPNPIPVLQSISPNSVRRADNRGF